MPDRHENPAVVLAQDAPMPCLHDGGGVSHDAQYF
jgi:hypothetical protein